MKKSFYSKLLMVAVMLCLPLLKSWAQIEIATVEDLRKIGASAYSETHPLNGSYVLINDIDLSGVENWVPIGMQTGHTFNTAGNALTNFTGTFDGRNHVIKNLTYSFTGNYDGLAFGNAELTGGLFGRIGNGTIKNLVLKNFTITGNCAGALAAALAPCTIENVSVIGCTISGGSEIGGLSGRTNNNLQIIKNCYIDPTTKIIGGTKVGGFIGNIGQAINVTMTNCYTAATMKGTDEKTVFGVIGDFGTPGNPGNMAFNAVFVMAQAAVGTTLEPMTPDNTKIGIEGSSYFACIDFFPSVADTAAVTLAALKEKTTYTNAGWDFDAVWKIEDGKFPIFQWQDYPTGINTIKVEPLWNVTTVNNRINVTVSEPLYLSVYDAAGKTLFANQVKTQVSIPTNRGIYILKVNGSGSEAVRKIIVK
jgi:hypothetical protein